MIFSKIPEKIVDHLFNLTHGTRVQRYCRNCQSVTEQVSVSYSDLAQLRNFEPFRLLGRTFDFVPGITVLGGRPTVCRCGVENR